MAHLARLFSGQLTLCALARSFNLKQASTHLSLVMMAACLFGECTMPTRRLPLHLLACPQCGASALQVSNSLNASALECTQCKTPFFSLGDIPCLFPGGEHHKTLLQHHLQAHKNQVEGLLESTRQSLVRRDLTAANRTRLECLYSGLGHSLETCLSLFAQHQLTPQLEPQFPAHNSGELTTYYDLILRDWAWDDAQNSCGINENQAALARTLQALPPNTPAGDTLVLGAGAGRLSWDIHLALKPTHTLAFDCNPLPLLVANRLIQHPQQPIRFSEIKPHPQQGSPVSYLWSLIPPEASTPQADTWFPILGNALFAPFKAHSFDTLITPWFIDVNGADVRDVIGWVQSLLKPGGLWINSGPLLYSPALAPHQRYAHNEIEELLYLSGFKCLTQHTETAPYLASPLESRLRLEEIWTFCAQAPQATATPPAGDPLTPSWLLLPHLPIPKGAVHSTLEYPLVQTLLRAIDGKHSINSLSLTLASQLNNGIDAKQTIIALFGELLAFQQQASSAETP